MDPPSEDLLDVSLIERVSLEPFNVDLDGAGQRLHA
jgi:hypothetical protein